MVAAKKTEREQARTLYREGYTYNRIVETLGVAKSSVSLWCRDIVRPRVKKVIVVRAKKAESAPPAERKGKPAPAPFEGYTAYEYKGSDGFIRIQMIGRNKKDRLSLARARYNMSIALGRRLEPHEVVRRLSSDHSDDSIGNLRLLVHGESLHPKAVKTRDCKKCGEAFTPTFDLRKYCSEECQQNAPRTVRVRPPTPPRVKIDRRIDCECVICETTFRALSGSETCSKECRGKLMRLIANHNKQHSG